MNKINLDELNDLIFKKGKELLNNLNYVEDGEEQEDKKSGMILSDKYYSLYDENKNLIDMVSYVCVWSSPKKDLLLRSYWERFIPEI
ncbi:hypothetical protein [Thomasclavelia cocleata]|uniref:hypothetical protein n=1 Tax=Thomasclavelia cocleata TaxID=69824 RepID=UPI00241CAE8B|nr:hypothetical protein [Thomasclavelia cocleata]